MLGVYAEAGREDKHEHEGKSILTQMNSLLRIVQVCQPQILFNQLICEQRT